MAPDPDHAATSSSSNMDPQSLQDLQRMKVDDLISWLVDNKTEALPTKARQKDGDEPFEGLSPATLKQKEEAQKKPSSQAKAAKQSTRKPLKRPPLLWKNRNKGKLVRKGVYIPAGAQSFELEDANAARLKKFDEEMGKHKNNLESHYSSYNAICGEIENDMKNLHAWKDILNRHSTDTEPEFIQRQMVMEPPLGMYDFLEDEGTTVPEPGGCKFFFFRLEDNSTRG